MGKIREGNRGVVGPPSVPNLAEDFGDARGWPSRDHALAHEPPPPRARALGREGAVLAGQVRKRGNRLLGHGSLGFHLRPLGGELAGERGPLKGARHNRWVLHVIYATKKPLEIKGNRRRQKS